MIDINFGSLESFVILYVTAASVDKHAATISSVIAKPHHHHPDGDNGDDDEDNDDDDHEICLILRSLGA